MSNSDLNKKLIYTTLVFYCVCSVTGLFAAIMIYIDQKIKQIPNFLGNLLGNLVALCFLTAALTFIPSMILVFISIDHLRKYMKKTKNSDSKKKLIYNTLVSCCVCCVIVLITEILRKYIKGTDNNDSGNQKKPELAIMTGIYILTLIPSMILVFISIDHQRKHMKKTKKKKS